MRAAKPTIRPLTPARMQDLQRVLAGGWGKSCWCMQPRLTAAGIRALPGPGTEAERRRAEMARLARRRRAPGLLAYADDQPVGWIAVAPRAELVRLDASRATPRVDALEVWVVPCVTVARGARGRGLALALILAAFDYAAEHGAPAVEAYPRAGKARVDDENAYFGTEPLFRKAGFRVVRRPPADLPRTWAPRVTMRRDC